MSPIVHGTIAWLFAFLLLAKVKDRRLAVIAGVATDLDGIFILFNRELFLEYHHTFGHSYVFGIMMAVIAAVLAKEHIQTGLVALGAFSLHLLADIFGSNWDIYPLYPFSDIGTGGKYFLPNWAIYGIITPVTLVASLLLVGFIMWYKDTSPLEWLSEKWDKRFVHSFTYFFREKCHICGSRAFGDCSHCGKKICSRHFGSMIKYNCEKCREK